MKSTYTTSWYGENFCIKSCHLKVRNLALQEIIFVTNNLGKLRYLENVLLETTSNHGECLFSMREGGRREREFGFMFTGVYW